MIKGLRKLFKNKEKEYFMLREILEQKSVFQALSKKFFVDDLKIDTANFPLKNWNRIVICASGSSNNAGEIAKYLFEDIAGITVNVEFASEFAHKKCVLTNNDLFIAISQSGNTADTYEALLKAKAAGATTFAITNNDQSKIHNEADFKVIADAGEEKSIAATKSFTAQLFILYTLALALGEMIQNIELTELKKEFLDLYNKYDEIFAQRDKIKQIAKSIYKTKSLVILSRNINYALAKEGSLKTKETCYINAVSAPGGEFLHGHFAFLDKKVPMIGIVNKPINDNDETYKLLVHNLQEVKSKRGSDLIVLKTVDDNDLKNNLNYKYSIDIPKLNMLFTPMINLVAIQLLAFETADLINDNVDCPRDLKKCVDSE